MEELRNYLAGLYRDLEVEIDIHGGRTVLAYNLRTLIIATEKELEGVK